MSERKQFGILQKVIYIADQSDVCHNICEYLDGEYQVIYKSISKVLKTSQMLGNIYALYIIEMTNFTQTSETLINKIRQNSNSPIFFVSKAHLAEKQKREAVYAFESGADDYLGFPLDIEKIVIRLRALIRMQERIHEQINIWHFQGLKIILESRQVFCGGTEIVLTKIEFDIICFLAQQNGRVVTYKELYEAVWNREYLRDDANIMAHIHRIRQKIEKDIKKPEYIQNVYGVGYRFGEFAQ